MEEPPASKRLRSSLGAMWNIGNGCYANASWSLLTCIPELIWFYGTRSLLVDALRDLASGLILSPAQIRMALGPSPIPLPTRAAGALNPHAFYTGKQQDAQEHLLQVIEHVEKHGAPTNLLTGRVEWVTKCLCCKRESSSFENFNECIVLMDGEDTGPISLRDHFEHFGKVERLEDDAYMCTTCKKKTSATRQPYIMEMPKYCLFFLNRFKKSSPWKIKRKMTVPDGVTIDGVRWLLKAVVHHHGDSVHVGHYTTNICVDFEQRLYMEINDERVRPTQSLRGDAITPYILLYIREESTSP